MKTAEQLGTPLPPMPGVHVRNPEVRSLYLAMVGLAQANPEAEWPAKVLSAFREFLRSSAYREVSDTMLIPVLGAWAIAYQTARKYAQNKGSDYEWSALRVAAGDVYASMDEFEAAVRTVYKAIEEKARGAVSALVLPLALLLALVWVAKR